MLAAERVERPDRGRRTRSLILALVVVLGALLRGPALDWGLPDGSHRWSYRVDESTFIQVLGELDPRRLDFVIESRGSRFGPGLAYMQGALLLAGDALGFARVVPRVDFYREHPEELGRLYLLGRCMVLLLSLLGIPFAYAVARRVVSSEAALWAALLVAVWPAHVQSGRFLLSDVPAGTFQLASLYVVLRYLDAPSFRRLALAAVLGAWAVSVKLSAALLLLPLVVAPMSARRFRDLVGVLALVAVLVPAFHPALLAPGSSESGRYVMASVLRPFEGSGRAASWGLWWSAGPVAAACFVAGCLVAARSRRVADLALLSSVLPFLLFLVGTGQDRSQLYTPAVGAMAVLAVLPLDRLGRGARPWGRIVLAAATLHAAAWSGAWVADLARTPIHDEVRDAIDRSLPAGTRIGYVQWFFIPHLSTERYEMIRMTEPGWEEKAEYVLLADYDLAAYAERMRGYRVERTWRRTPSLLGFRYDPPHGHDARFTFPTLVLWRRLEGEEAPGGAGGASG